MIRSLGEGQRGWSGLKARSLTAGRGVECGEKGQVGRVSGAEVKTSDPCLFAREQGRGEAAVRKENKIRT